MKRPFHHAAGAFAQLLITLVVLMIATRSAAAQELRTWTDKSGQHKIEATFVSETGGKVQLQRADGKRLEIALELLSNADQDYVRDWKSKMAADSPFKELGAGATPAAEGQPKVASVNLSSAREVAPVPQDATWKFDTPPATSTVSAAEPKSFAYSGDGFKFEGIATSWLGQRVLLSFSRKDAKKYPDPDKQIECRYVLADVSDGRTTDFQLGPLDATMRVMAINGDGTSAIVLRSVWGFGNSDRLEHWRFTKAGIQRESQWTPYEESKGGNRDVSWACYLEGDKAVTVSGGGSLVLWDLAKLQPVYRFAIKGGSTPGVSPDGKLACYSREEDIGVLDLEKGVVIAAQKAGANLTWPNLRFSPDGTLVACLDHQRLKVWNFLTGDLQLDTPRSGFPTGGYRFVSNNHVLISGKTLYDLQNQLMVWNYEGAAAAEEFGAYCCFVAGGAFGRPGSVLFERLPQSVVTDTLTRAMKDPDFWILTRGTTVKLDLAGLPDPDQRKRVGELLTQKLADHDVRVGNSGSVTLVASVRESPEKKEVSYSRGFSPFGRGVPLKVREFTSQVTFTYEGKTAWEQSGNNIPGSLSLKDGEAITEALKRHEKPNYSWFDKVELPVVLRKPTGSPTLGTSKVTDAGLR